MRFLNLKDEDLIDKVITDLSNLGIMDKQAVNFANVSRSKYAYVINDLDYRNLALLNSILKL